MGKIIPELNEKFTSMAFCVPTENLLVMDRTYCLEKLQRMRSSKKKKKVNQVLEGPLRTRMSPVTLTMTPTLLPLMLGPALPS